MGSGPYAPGRAPRNVQAPCALRGENPRTRDAANLVVDGVADNRRGNQRQDERRAVEDPGGRQRAAGKQQRVAWKERRDDEPRFGEHDQEEDPVDPGSIRGRDVRQVLVEMQEEIDQGAHAG